MPVRMKTKKRKQPTTTPEEASNAFLQPIAEAAAEVHGSKKRLAEALTERTGQPVPRGRVERWLNKDPGKRQQPLLGSGLLLAEEAARLLAEQLNGTKRTKGRHGNTNGKVRPSPSR
jgi:hypothetical protein